MFEKFWNNCFNDAINLKERFKLLEEQKWDELTIMNEFMIQLGHYSMLISGEDIAKENGRNIHDYADEISDILLQLCAFCNIKKIQKEDIKYKKIICNDEKVIVMNIMSLTGQIIETILEDKKYRFNKERFGYKNKNDFIVDRISKIISLVFSIIEHRKIDIINSFKTMCIDANSFIDKKLHEYEYPIVDLHASWIALNPIQGCPNSCKYCFLSGVNLTKTTPKILATPQETVYKLINSPYYYKDIPICIETETDAFATPSNIKYIEELLNELDRNKIMNLKVFITKCLIPDEFIKTIKFLESKKHKFLFFISYSGLENDIEIGINKQNIKNNFINLNKYNLPIVHYWRPFLPQNSDKEKILDVYNFVKKYAKCSVAIGLKVKESYKNNLKFWNALEEIDDTTCAESIWTQTAYKYIWGKSTIIDKEYPIFKTTSCAIAYATKNPEKEACYNSFVCKNDNRCPKEQRDMCLQFYKELKKVDVNYIVDILKKLDLIDKNSKYNIEINDTEKVITIHGVSLNTKDFSLLSLLTRYKIKANKSNSDYYWNSFINDAKQIII